MTGLTPPVHRRIWRWLLQELAMGSGTHIVPNRLMAGHTDLRTDIGILLLRRGGILLLRRGGRRLLTRETASHHPCADEYYQPED
jgi:hypothetical protein